MARLAGIALPAAARSQALLSANLLERAEQAADAALRSGDLAPATSIVLLHASGRLQQTRQALDAGLDSSALPTHHGRKRWFSIWREAPQLAQLLANLPRPLWISVYDSANVGPDALVDGLMAWLPPDVGIFFQDGVGVHAREAKVARHYADVMSARLGRDRVRLIAGAFRPQQGGGFRSATAAEIRSQLRFYGGYRVYLFDGPHYVHDALVTELAGPRAK